MGDRDAGLEDYAVEKLGWSKEKVQRTPMRDLHAALRKAKFDYVKNTQPVINKTTSDKTNDKPVPPVAFAFPPKLEPQKASEPNAMVTFCPLPSPLPAAALAPAPPQQKEQPAQAVIIEQNAAVETTNNIEEIGHRMGLARDKVQKLLEIRQHMSVDADFDRDHLLAFDECIGRAKSHLQQEHTSFIEKFKKFQTGLASRVEKEEHIFKMDVVDDELKRDWTAKRKQAQERIVLLEKAIACGFLLEHNNKLNKEL